MPHDSLSLYSCKETVKLTVCTEYPSYIWKRPCIRRTGTPFRRPNNNLDLWPGAVDTGKFGISE